MDLSIKPQLAKHVPHLVSPLVKDAMSVVLLKIMLMELALVQIYIQLIIKIVF